MPHISKRKIDKKLWRKISEQVLTVFARAKNNQKLYSIFNELFTQTERIMFSKRIAIVLMLENNTPQHHIADMLGVSPSTVARASLNIQLGKYDSIISLSKREKIDLEKIIWNIATVHGIMPPKFGSRRYWRKYSKT